MSPTPGSPLIMELDTIFEEFRTDQHILQKSNKEDTRDYCTQVLGDSMFFAINGVGFASKSKVTLEMWLYPL